MEEFLELFYITFKDSMMYSEETNNKYVYYYSIPGLVKDDLDIRLYTEKDFVTIRIINEKENNFVGKFDVKIVKLVSDVDKDKTPEVLVDKGVLEVSIFKANPTIEKIL